MAVARALGEDQLAELEPVLRRVVAARVRDPHAVDDLVQEALGRLVAAAGRLGDRELLPYAIVTARNLAATKGRDEERAQRNAPRLLERREPPRPDEELLRREEAEAVEAALGGLPEADRQAFVSHTLDGVSTADLARALSSTPGGVAVRLARARARLRVDYLVALEKAELPTARCRPVLLALSAGDRRRQEALRAGEHLLACAVCARLATPLLERQRSVAALVPLLGLRRLSDALPAWTKDRRAQAASAAAAAALVVAGVAAAQAGGEGDERRAPVGAPRPAAGATAGPGAASPAAVVRLPLPAGDALARHVGQRVEATDVAVESVVGDEAFWVGTGPADRVLVVLTRDAESPVRVSPGRRVDLTGRVMVADASLAARAGLDAAEGAAQVGAQGAYVEAPGVVVRPG